MSYTPLSLNHDTRYGEIVHAPPTSSKHMRLGYRGNLNKLLQVIGPAILAMTSLHMVCVHESGSLPISSPSSSHESPLLQSGTLIQSGHPT